MSGYLQRLVARVRPTPESSVQPFVHTRSPIAARDQRIGLPGFEAAAANSPEATGGQEIHGAARPVAARAWSHPLRQRGAGLMPRRETAATSDPAAAGTDSSPRPHAGAAQSRSPFSEAARREHVFAERADATQRVDTRRRAVHDEASVPRPRTPDHAPADAHRRKTTAELGDPVAGSAAVTEQRPPLRPATHGREERPVAVDAFTAVPRTSVGATLPGELQLRDSQTAIPTDIPAAAPTLLEDRSQPWVEIGAIQVEVVAPPSPPESRSTPPAGPVTAESVSRIGPLAARRRSNLRFTMRVR